MRSIKKTLLSGLILGIFVCSSAVMIILFLAIREEIYEIMDYQMEQMALTVNLQKNFKIAETSSGFEQKTVNSIVQIWDSKGNLIYSTNPATRISAVSKQGFSTLLRKGGNRWRIYVLTRQGLDIQVAQPLLKRQKSVLFIALETSFSLLFLAVVLVIWVYLIVNKSFKPMQKICDSIRERKVSRLDFVNEAEVPEEILPLVRELNALFARLDVAIKRQKEFLYNAAHELRTPLTVVDLQIQNALEMPDTTTLRPSLKKMKKGINRVTSMVNQLLMVSRTEEEALGEKTDRLNFLKMIEDILSEYVILFDRHRISLHLLKPEGAIFVVGNLYGLKAMASSLIDNALKYSPSGTLVTLDISTYGENLLFEVNDEGPGIPPKERQKVFRRFYRYHGERALGSGLGLSIVKNVVDYHGGEISLEDGIGEMGVKVRVVLPLHGKASKT